MVTINTMGDFNHLTIEEIQEADLIIIASTVVRSDLYFKRLGALAGSPALPAKGGRYFTAAYKSCLREIDQRTKELKTGGAAEVAAHLKEVERKRAEEREASKSLLPTNLGNTAKRLNSLQMVGKSKKACYKATKADAKTEAEEESEEGEEAPATAEETVSPIAKGKRVRAPPPPKVKAAAAKAAV
eukprot:9284219-Pyramimonas_sp.AAC.1